MLTQWCDDYDLTPEWVDLPKEWLPAVVWKPTHTFMTNNRHYYFMSSNRDYYFMTKNDKG